MDSASFCEAINFGVPSLYEVISVLYSFLSQFLLIYYYACVYMFLMLCNNTIGFVNHGLYCVFDENLYLDRNISLAIPCDKNFHRISSFIWKRRSLKLLERDLEKKTLKKIHSFLEKLTKSRGKNCCIFGSKLVEQLVRHKQKKAQIYLVLKQTIFQKY